MIKTNELRIGNWVSVNGKPILVENVNDGGINGDWDGSWYEHSAEDLKPVPLIPEILEQCGFENVYQNKWVNDSVELEYHEINEGYYLLNGEERINWQPMYRFLHQLQNLYFALTGEELKLSGEIFSNKSKHEL